MNIQLQINSNTILYYIEDSQTHDDSEHNTIIDSYQLSFGFYDCQYFIGVSKKDIETENTFGICIDGDTKLFDSFEEQCQNELWPLIKKYCLEYEEWYNKNCR